MRTNQVQHPWRGLLYPAVLIALGFLLTGCLSGCVASGNYKYTLKSPFGEVSWAAEIAPAEGEKESWVSFDNWMKKLIDSWTAPAKSVESTGVVTVETVEATNPVTMPDGTRAHAPPSP